VSDAFISASGLGLATRQGPAFSNLSFDIAKGALAVFSGPAGSGRSALLLAIAGRMRKLTGSLWVAGLDAIGQSKEVRRTVSLARISGLVDLEGQLTVTDSFTERALMDAVPETRAAAVFGHAETILDVTFDRRRLVDDLPALDRTLLAVALATLRPAHVLVLDDADLGLALADQHRLMAALQRVTDTGITVVASTIVTEAVPATAQTFPLTPPA